MNKIQNIEGVKQLSREQLKNIVGGDDCGNGCPDGQVPCTCSSDKGTFSGCVSSIADCWNKC
jgi:hypothetical protein